MTIVTLDDAPPARPLNRTMVTMAAMTATIMVTLDSTIANVALPHMQGATSASADQIVWVLTSYIVASAIFTPLTGWLSGRFGRRNLFLAAVAGFTVASLLCGIANSLTELVAFRVIQGVFGAALMPLSQALMFDINPPEKHGQAMAVWGMGAMLGPLMGPVVGGWLTEHVSWRWCFLINLPIGALTLAGIWFFIHDDKKPSRIRLDFFGFAALAIAIAAFQLMLDRGQAEDWFASPEIWIEALTALVALAVCVIHTLTAPHPFIPRALFQDRNFVASCFFGIAMGLLVFASTALTPQMTQHLLGYPVLTTGLVMAPRGLGVFIAMIFAGRLTNRFDPRLIMLVGFAACGLSSWLMSGFSFDTPPSMLGFTGLLQGFGTGLIFVPLTVVAFSTLNPVYRTEGAAISTVLRNIGSAVGISLMQALQIQKAATLHADMAETVLPGAPGTVGTAIDFNSVAGLAGIEAEVSRQSAMTAYVNVFWLMAILSFLAIPLLLAIQRRRARPGDEPVHTVMD